jgi:AmmeMemoRadiSam system protein A
MRYRLLIKNGLRYTGVLEDMADTQLDLQSGLSPKDKETLRELARVTIRARALGEPLPEVKAETEALRRETGAFVSLHRRGMLRGCIGYVEAVAPLAQAVQDMALSAAFQDPRFDPLTAEELDELEIEISVLTPFEKITDPESIEVGLHGLMIRKGSFSGLLLPQVPVQFGWDRQTFISQTCQKAGLRPDAWQDSDIEFFIFSAEIF